MVVLFGLALKTKNEIKPFKKHLKYISTLKNWDWLNQMTCLYASVCLQGHLIPPEPYKEPEFGGPHILPTRHKAHYSQISTSHTSGFFLFFLSFFFFCTCISSLVHPKNFDKARENTHASKSNCVVKIAFTFKIPQLLAYCGYKVQRILFVDFSTSLPLASISSQQIFFHVFSLLPCSHVLQGKPTTSSCQRMGLVG